MQNRTVLIILGLAVALLAFILLFERETMTTDELAGRKDRVFVAFDREAVERLTLQGTDGQRVELERVNADESGEDAWKIVAPRALPADGSAVRGALSAIDFLIKDRTVEGENVATDARYGLAEPRVEGTFTVRGTTTGFRVGAASQDGQKVYVALAGVPTELYAVERDFFDSINLGIDELRDKRLISEPLSDAVAIRAARAGEPLDLAREPGTAWRVLREGQRVLAAEDQVADLLVALGRVEAAAFVADDVGAAALGQYGLDQPTRVVTVTLPDERGETRLLLGTPCAEEGQIHATVDGSGTVACVAAEITTQLDRPLARMCEMRPAVFREEDVSRIAITRGGAELALERDDEEHRWVLAGAGAPAVEQSAVSDLLAMLGRGPATSLTVGDAAIADLGAPAAKIAIELDAGQPAIALDLWPGDTADVQLVRRGDERAVLAIATDLLALVQADPLAFARRTIENGKESDVIGLSVDGPLAQRLERDAGEWKLVSPISVAADGASTRELAGLLATIEVERFAAAAARPEHGLAQPFEVVSARFVEEAQADGAKDRTGERTVVLEIGAPADPQTRFARVRGTEGPVFTVGGRYLDALARPLAARDLLQIDDIDTVRLQITRGDASLNAELRDGAWTADGAQVDSAALKRLVADLAAIKAIRADGFGAPGPDDPRAREPIRISAWTAAQLAAGSPKVVVLGAATPDEAEHGRYAWGAEIDITYVIPDRIVDDIEHLLARHD
jgi:hypothetical protein